MHKNKAAFLIPAVFAAAAVFAPLARAWEILSWDTVITVDKDTTVNVTETLRVDFQSEIRHGIYRFIPVIYRIKGRAPYVAPVNFISAADESGRIYPYRITREGDNRMLRIGSPSQSISGMHTYRIRYRARNVIQQYDGKRDELYWNVTGNEWTVPISRVSAAVEFPGNIPAGDVRTRCFSGTFGSTNESGCTDAATDGGAKFSIGRLKPGEGLTIVVSVPKGQFTYPGGMTKAVWWIKDFIDPALSFSLAAFIVTLAVMFGLWWSFGRDAPQYDPVVVRYAPPEDLTPAEIGTLLDEKADRADIVSIILDLAARGFMKIREMGEGGFFGLSKKDYEFRLLRQDYRNAGLKKFEVELLDGLFGAKKTYIPGVKAPDTVLLSSLRGKFSEHLNSIEGSIYQSLVDKRYFMTRPDRLRTYYMVGGVVWGALIFFIGTMVFDSGMGWMFCIPAGLTVILFGRIMPRKYPRGAMALREALGLKEFIVRAEKDRIKRMADEQPELFGRMLPFAMVMGAAEAWAERFGPLMQKPPDWYESSRPMGAFQAQGFMHDLDHGMRSMGAALAMVPKASGSGGWSGGSGFGGGGFSGGGFGGGGGGAW